MLNSLGSAGGPLGQFSAQAMSGSGMAALPSMGGAYALPASWATPSTMASIGSLFQQANRYRMLGNMLGGGGQDGGGQSSNVMAPPIYSEPSGTGSRQEMLCQQLAARTGRMPPWCGSNQYNSATLGML
jgi:hypothetical protein